MESLLVDPSPASGQLPRLQWRPIRAYRSPRGRTRLAGTTWYKHHMWPASYWGLWSDFWIIHRIHLRVLQYHVKAVQRDGENKPRHLQRQSRSRCLMNLSKESLFLLPPFGDSWIMEIKRAGSQSSVKGSAEYFTGNVRIDPLFEATLFRAAPWAPASPSTRVPAPPGTLIPLGQILIVTAGCGWATTAGADPKKKSVPATSSGFHPVENTGTAPRQPRA